MYFVIDDQLLIGDDNDHPTPVQWYVTMYFVIDDQLMIGDHLRLQGL